MARIVKKHPRDFRVGDIVVFESLGEHETEITEIFGWSETSNGWAFRTRTSDWSVFFGDTTYRVK